MSGTLENYVHKLSEFLKSQHSFMNCHMVDFLTKNLWEKIIPHEIREEIGTNFKEAINLISSNNYQKFPSLTQFIDQINEYTLDQSIAIDLDRLNSDLDLSSSVYKLNHFMGIKKMHEVNILANLIWNLAEKIGVDHLIDLGDGKGYLSSLLALHYKLNVLGIDCSETNTESSKKRLEKLQRLWGGLNDNNTPLSNNEKNKYQQLTRYITKDVSLSELIIEHFQVKAPDIGLIGLHTCGNLASTSIKLYKKNEKVRLLTNVGCCYHFIEERFAPSNLEIYHTPPPFKDDSIGFPMSRLLNDKKFKLERNARMLASQCLDRTNGEANIVNRSIFYRALFQVILQDFNVTTSGQVGRKISKCTNFYEYVKAAIKKLNLDLNLNESDVNCYLDKYKDDEYKLYFFYLLRMRLAHLIEALILSDRLLYLKQNGLSKSYIVKLFDPVISPRCYGIVSMRV